MIVKKNEGWNPSEHVKEFVDLAKHLLFIAQGDSRAPVTGSNRIDKTVDHVERASSVKYIFHWTPQQLSLVQALELLYVIIGQFFQSVTKIFEVLSSHICCCFDPVFYSIQSVVNFNYLIKLI